MGRASAGTVALNEAVTRTGDSAFVISSVALAPRASRAGVTPSSPCSASVGAFRGCVASRGRQGESSPDLHH